MNTRLPSALIVGLLFVALPARADDDLPETERARRARVGSQVLFAMRADPRYQDVELDLTWAEPYAVVQVGSRLRPEELQRRIDLLQRIHRTLLAEHGERCGFRDLLAPWGGRPDLPEEQRRFEDGIPLVVCLYREEPHFLELALGGRTVPPTGVGAVSALLARDGTAHVRIGGGHDRLAETATGQLLWWLYRQQRRWHRPQRVLDPLLDGFASWFGTRAEGPEAERRRLERMQRRALAFAERDRPYPVFDVQQLLYAGWSNVVVGEAQGTRQVLAEEARAVYDDQCWAFVRMLGEQDDGAFRETLGTWLEAWLGGLAGARRSEAWQRAFGVDDDAGWDAVNAAWHAYLAEAVLEPVGVAPPGGRRLLVELARYGRGEEDGTLVLLTASDAHAMDPKTHKVAVHLPYGAPPRERFERLVRALEVFPRSLDGRRRQATLHHRRLRSRKAPGDDERLTVLALLAAGYRDVELDATVSPTARALLEAWRSADAPGPR